MMDERFIMVDFKTYIFVEKDISKISYSFSRGYRSITRFVKRRIRMIFSFKGVFFVKLLGITFFRLFIKTVPPRYIVTPLSTSQVQNTFHLHFFFLKTLTPFQSCMAIQLSMTADAAIRIVLSLHRGALYPQEIVLPPGVTPGLPDGYTEVSVVWSRPSAMSMLVWNQPLQLGWFSPTPYDPDVSIRFPLSSYRHDRRPSRRSRWVLSHIVNACVRQTTIGSWAISTPIAN